MEKIWGREEEIQILDKLLNSKKPEFLAVYGRRRVGKTYLIDRYFRSKGVYLHFTGMKGASLKEHLVIFRDVFLKKNLKAKTISISSWLEAFAQLREVIDRLDKTQKIILFFDELPWIDTRKSGFLKALDHFWNDYFSRMSNAILIVCGSAASWMIQKIVYNKGGLHNRLTSVIRLEPFSLSKTKSYLEGQGIHLSKKQTVDVYMATGGVAKYLSYIERGQSSSQIIQNLCFRKNSPLVKEYEILYSSLFDNYAEHISVVEALSKKRIGLTHTELLKATKRSSGGRFTAVLDELKEAGFISVIPALNKKKKESKYYLSDEYSFFYLTWIKPATSVNFQSVTADYWLSQHGSAKFASWAGFAFETICKKHISEIIRSLKLEVVATGVIYWADSARNEGHSGFQIDLIIDRADRCMNLCEIKFHNSELTFSPEEARKAIFRRERFREVTKSTKTLFNTLISVYGARENPAYMEGFDNQLTIDALF